MFSLFAKRNRRFRETLKVKCMVVFGEINSKFPHAMLEQAGMDGARALRVSACYKIKFFGDKLQVEEPR